MAVPAAAPAPTAQLFGTGLELGGAMYVDPGTLMPIASAIAAIAGGLLVFWRRVVAALRALARWLVRLFRRR